MATQNITDKDAILDRASAKAGKRLIPFLCLMFILAFLDRTNIGFAQTEFQQDTGLSNAAYALGAGIFFFGYALCEVPSNMVLYKVGARRWLARIMVTWGIVAAAMAWAHTETAFYIIRFLLGATEAGFYPGVILYMTFWFPSKKRAQMNALFQFGAPLAFVIGGPISGLILQNTGHWFGGMFHGWQNMFIVEGLAASIVGVIAWFYLTDNPRSAKWLTKEESEILSAAIEAEGANVQQHGQAGMFRALLDWRVLYLCLVCFTIQVLGYGYNFYIPTQVAKLLGTNVGFLVGVVTGIPAIVAIIGLAIVPRYSEKIGNRRGVGTAVYACGAIGIVLSGILTHNPVLCIIALCIAYFGHIVIQPIFWANCTTYLTGGAAASGIALIGALGNLGGFVGPNIRNWATEAFGSDTAGLYILGIFAAVGVVMFAATGVLSVDRTKAVTKAGDEAIEKVQLD